MIECIFTIDYEIYGNGEGALAELVYKPARRLKQIFDEAGARCVVFVEVAELEMIAKHGTDSAINDVEEQIREFHDQGFEIGLHLHPQWYNGRYHGGKWQLDYSEYNLCTLPRERINEIVSRSIAYLRKVLRAPTFTPLSFRAGNWLFQPSKVAAEVLWDHGIRIDSSVFKGGVQRAHHLDYRSTAANGYYWRFQSDVCVASENGPMLELPIFTRMVPFWQMLTAKRVALHRQGSAISGGGAARAGFHKVKRLRDYFRLWYPLKLDFCRMSLPELVKTVEDVCREHLRGPDRICPLVAIGHTKDLVDLETIRDFLRFLKERGIVISTLRETSLRCGAPLGHAHSLSRSSRGQPVACVEREG